MSRAIFYFLQKLQERLVPLWREIKGVDFLIRVENSSKGGQAAHNISNIFHLSVLLIFTSFLCSCGPNYIFDEEKPITDSNWTYTDSLTFQFEVTDTSKVYNLNLEIDHSMAYRHQNLYVQIATLFPSKKRDVQVISLELANKYGAWLGDCGSENCTLLIPLQQQIYFQETGGYEFVLKQFMRESPVGGINKFTLKIEETDLQK